LLGPPRRRLEPFRRKVIPAVLSSVLPFIGVVAATATAWATLVPGQRHPTPWWSDPASLGMAAVVATTHAGLRQGILGLSSRIQCLLGWGGAHGGGILAIAGGQRRPAALIASSGAVIGGQWWLQRAAMLRARQRKPGLRAWPSRRG
jgi:hypothetical protein